MIIKWKKKWLVLAAVILTAVGFAAAHGKKGAIQEEPAADDARLVVTEEAKLDKVSRYSDLSGVLSPGEEAVISFEASGRITDMNYQEGDL